MVNVLRLLWSSCFIGAIVFGMHGAEACTGIRLTAEDGAVIYARTMEFGMDTKSAIITIPRNYDFIGIAPSGKAEGLRWKSKYAALGANAVGVPYLIDGVNERGLGGGFFYFAGAAEYQNVGPHEYSKSISSWQLLTWLLTNFASVDEVVKELPKILVNKAIYELWNKKTPPPFHTIVHDSSGKCIVIEYINGGILKIHDNPLGVITNVPTFDWHMTNIRNYLDLSPLSKANIEFSGLKFFPLGQGSGMFGLPGDYTSPSRFIRAVEFSQSSVPVKSAQEAIKRAFHLLNPFDVPYGSVRVQDNGNLMYNYTQWTSASDLKNKKYYFHTFENRQLHVVDLMKTNHNAHKIDVIPMNHSEKIIDITPVYKNENKNT